MRFVDLFAGIGGFHVALSSLGHECVFACEINETLRELYQRNFRVSRRIVAGDIRSCVDRVPPHDVLCAGFPCQPFSKSGGQEGPEDETRGTLFHEILTITRLRRPRLVLLENVGNFERHDGGKTWRVVRSNLESLGYHVRGTEHVMSGGHGLISPHHLGFPQTRERFFVVASIEPLPDDPFPPRARHRETHLSKIVQPTSEIPRAELLETALSPQQIRCVDHWNKLIQSMPAGAPLPSFPIWGDEASARYPFERATPFALSKHELLARLGRNGPWARLQKGEILRSLPNYAREQRRRFPSWKVGFISRNRAWFRANREYIPPGWVRGLKEFPPSLRKLEWNCQGEPRDLWRCVLQFRPSGLRAKRYCASPSLVAMTATQVPILGPERRYITRVEALRLQGFPDDHRLPAPRAAAFRALGNAVHVGVVRAIASRAAQD